VERGQLLQSEGYRFIFEEARRQKPVCSMALNWCFNEPWPSAANNNLVSWPHRPKPAYYAVQAACRPVLSSARAAKFSFQPGESFEAEVWLLNDSPGPVAAGSLEVSLDIGGRRLVLASWAFPELLANQNARGPTVRCDLPNGVERTFQLLLQVSGRPTLDSQYTFVLRNGRVPSAALGPRPLNA